MFQGERTRGDLFGFVWFDGKERINECVLTSSLEPINYE